MAQQISTTKKYRIILTQDELQALSDRLVSICPADYSLEEFAILRNLYGRFTHILLRDQCPKASES